MPRAKQRITRQPLKHGGATAINEKAGKLSLPAYPPQSTAD
jgi:hypothetical protein